MKLKIGIGSIFGVLLLIGTLIITNNSHTDQSVTVSVTRGDIANTISVSGFIEATKTADLSFPVVGIVTDIFVSEGDTVKKGDLLATLGSQKLVAQRADAVASLQRAQAVYTTLIEGPTFEERSISQTNVTAAKEALDEIIKTENEKVATAFHALVSNDLKAYAVNPNESATPPTVSGTYMCTQEGVYTLSVYNSGTVSGYSYQLTGLENNTYPVTTNQPAPLGTCGLLVQFTDGDSYAFSKWNIPVPNTKSTSYATYKNAYDLAIAQREQRITTAKNNLLLAQRTQEKETANPRNTSVQQYSADMRSAQARIAQIDAQIADLSIVAPFDGIVTAIDIQPGETGTTKPVITVLAQDVFELKARVPEIDIKEVTTGQLATVWFDADPTLPLRGTVTFISPLATIIDGVAYFDTKIALDTVPPWIRSGLNADIDITIASYTDVLKIPKRYLINDEAGHYTVQIQKNNEVTQVPIEVRALTNDGYAAIEGLKEGEVIIAP